MKNIVKAGIDFLLPKASTLLKNRRVALLSNQASITSEGMPTFLALQKAGIKINVLFGPEHGFSGVIPPGKKIASGLDPLFKIPFFSLYGKTLSPTSEMLSTFDTLIWDLQDIGARPYTFVTTLRYFMESVSGKDKELIIADRIIPLPHKPDGPLLQPSFQSFVSSIPVPMMYAMTPGEIALWLKNNFKLDINLSIYKIFPPLRSKWIFPCFPSWIPPSPGITTWESAICYTATVFSESFPDINIARGTPMSFRVFGAEWVKPTEVLNLLNENKVDGVCFYPYLYFHNTIKKTIPSIRIHINNINSFKPVSTSIYILSALQKIRGTKKLWEQSNARPHFFDTLYGTDSIRKYLQEGKSPTFICNIIKNDINKFLISREKCLLYE